MLLKNRYKNQLPSRGSGEGGFRVGASVRRRVTPKLAIALLLVGMFLAGPVWAQADNNTIRVRHDHDPWGACEGELTISTDGIDYLPEKEDEHVRHWKWIDIQTVDRYSSDRFSILSYEDQKWLLGRDRPWNFRVLDGGSEGLTDRLFRLIRTHSPRPVVDRMVREIEAEYEVPVKHLHTFGGCEGTLRFGEDWIVYETDHEEDARSWRQREEVVNIWSTGRYDLELEVYEPEGEDLLRTRRWHFQLKQPLDQEYYDRLRRAMLPPR